MTKSQIGGIVRTIAAAALGYLAGKGLIAGGDVDAIASAVGTLGVAVWSVMSKKD